MPFFRKRLFARIQKSIAFFFVSILILSSFFDVFLLERIPVVEAAEVTIDPDVNTTSSTLLQSGSQTVFINDQTGYKFFRDVAGYCVYRKTTNAGATWSGTTTVDSQTDCLQITVWYDKWTPGSASSSIHIATMDNSADDVWYNRLDTDTDNLLLGSSPVSTLTGSGQGGTTLNTSENFISITRGTDGTLYVLSNDGSSTNDSFVLECSVSCNVNTNWIEATTSPLDVASDQNILVPLDNGDIMIVQRDISANDMRSRRWNNGTGSWQVGWTTIDANATGNTTYDVGFAVTISSSTPGEVFLAYIARNTTLGTDDQIRTARYSGGSWATSTDVVTSTTRGITNVAIGLDAANDDVYVAYSARTTAGTANTANVYWKSATSSMVNWSAESAAVNASSDDIYGVDLNLASDERLYVTWNEAGPDDIFGETIADVFPGIHATTTGSQVSSVNASTSNVYVGGAFVLYNTYRPIDVSGITITENGSIDGFTDIANIKLLYETSTSSPYRCTEDSYSGNESQFGSTDLNGFSGANGIASFSGTTVQVSTTTSLCLYVVLDVLDSATTNETIDIQIVDPATDITATGPTGPSATVIDIQASTTVLNDMPTQTHYHWRNDDGSELAATSRTSGVEDTSLAAIQQGSPVRLRTQISNEGGSSTPTMQYRVEYAPTTGACNIASPWIDVGGTGGDFDMFDSTHLTDGSDTTNIAGASGGVSDENTTFLTPNGGVKDTSSETGGLVLSSTQYVELEYSIVASTTATEGNTYCFRVTDRGNPLFAYSNYGRLTIASDVVVSATGTQIATAVIPVNDVYIGGAYTIVENSSSRSVTSITLTETGTIDAENDLDEIRLFYDLDTSNPYNCASESYGGNELQYGATSTGGFSSANGTSTFTGSVTVTTTSALCVYVVLDTTATAQNEETIDITIDAPPTNIAVSGGGSIGPATARDITGSTTLQGAVLTQTHYHWRNDNGNETAATSLTGGSADTPVDNIAQTTPVRLRLQVSNEGAVTSASRAFTLEYAPKITTCAAVGSWTNVGDVGGAWDMATTTNLTDASDTTNIVEATGGVADENVTFLTPNSAVKDASSTIASTTLSSSEYLEAEFSIKQTTEAGFDITYCFRLSTTQVELNAYSVYPELTTSPERDFEIQRGTFTMTGTTFTLTAGVDYVAPTASTSAFIRITNSHYTGAGRNALGGNQNSDDVTAYIQNPSDILTSVTFARLGAADNTRISWEIVEFIGAPGSDNEIVVRSQTSVTYGIASTTATGTAVTGVADDTDVVVFITGQLNPDTATGDYNTGQSTSAWLASSDQPVFTRGEASSDATRVSYAVVEFTGQNWAIQRVQHTYTSAGVTETESITALNSTSRAFLHTQKRAGTGLSGMDEFGAEVWLSSISQISFFLQAGANTPSDQFSVVWVIENLQTSSGAMDVTRSLGNSVNGTEPFTLSVPIEEFPVLKVLDDITNASIFITNRAAGTGANYPRPIIGATIASTTHYEIWRSDTGSAVDFRTEIVEWPTAGLAIQQNYYQLYVDNNDLIPTDPWPVGATDLGENTVLTGSDEPLGEAERIRIRMTIRAVNSTLPAGTKAFRLQYAPLTTTCSAIASTAWQTLGNSASSTVWRGYDALSVADGTVLSGNPPTVGDLKITSVADVAGSYEESNDSIANTYSLPENEDMEFDWLIEQNGAVAETFYCFRMIESDGTPLASYTHYPQIRTASFTPRSQNWRWYAGASSETPSTPLAAENVAPIDMANTATATLRIAVAETKNIARDDVRFRLQYSEYANFSVPVDVVATSTCTATSTWCYVNGGGVDNARISSSTLSDVQPCVASVGDGCGTHVESPDIKTGYRHESQAIAEYSFTIQSAGPRVNQVYYFRLYDTVQDIPVPAESGESYPSLVTEGASLSFSMNGIASSTVVEGVTLDIDTTPTRIPFGTLLINTAVEGAHRLSIDSNGTEGHQILMMLDGDLLNYAGARMEPITGTNATPVAWSTGCEITATSCFGYHTGDDTLEGGSTRFSALDTYARLSTTTLEEVSYSSQPVEGEITDIVFRLFIRQLQDAGQYEARIRYVSVPLF